MAKKKIKSKQTKLPVGSAEKRRFIRHPICYPLKYKIQRQSFKSKTANISEGVNTRCVNLGAVNRYAESLAHELQRALAEG